MRQRRFNSQH